MRCTSPVSTRYGSVPCGHCLNCKINRGQEWSLRLYHEKQSYSRSGFITLTYRDDDLPTDSSLSVSVLQNYIKRLRFELNDRKIKYYGVGEYGEMNFRPHFHLITFGMGVGDEKVINKCWDFGFTYTDVVNIRTINYVTRYVTKKLYGKYFHVYKDKGVIPPFSIMSHGLGKDWLDKNKQQIINWVRIPKDGKMLPVPRYYLKKLYESGELDKETVEDLKILKMADKALSEIQLGHDNIEYRHNRGSDYYRNKQRDADTKAKLITKPGRCKTFRPQGPGV